MPRAIPPNPYQGLFAFRETESHFFFGREEVVKVLTERVANNSLQTIVGASGSGKSSVVFAGLVPEFRKREWRIQDFRPGRNPYRNLARALLKLQGKENPDSTDISKLGNSLEQGETKLLDVLEDTLEHKPNATLLLIVDQFEELFTISEANLSEVTTTQDKDSSVETTRAFDPKPFIDQLLEGTRQNHQRFHLLLTLRADFMGRASSHRAFADALNHESTLYTLGPMNSQELQAATEKPAEKQGVMLEEGLSERILQEVARQEGSLPLLEFALSELWLRQDNGILTHRAYDSIGGVEGALARHADAAYNSLKSDEQLLAQRVFLQLVYPGEGQEDTRRVASYQELKGVWSVVNTLATKRLLVTDESEGQQTAEVIHEALIRRWGKLREWMNDHRAFRTWQERLRQDVNLWRETGQASSTLLSGYRLDEALKMRKDYDSLLSEDEHSFIEAGLQQHEHEEAFYKAQQQREIEALKKINEVQILRTEAERSGRRNTRRWLNIALFSLMIAIITAIYAFVQRNEAKQTAQQLIKERERADQEARRASEVHSAQMARASELVAKGELEYEENPLLGLQVALEGLMILPDGEETRLKDLTRAANNLALRGRLLKLGDDVGSVYLPEIPDWFITKYATKIGELRNFSHGRVITTLSGNVSNVIFSPSKKWFVVAYHDAPIELREVAKPETAYPISVKAFAKVGFSSDEKWLAIYNKESLELREIAKPKTTYSVPGKINSVSFSPDSKWLVIDYDDSDIPDELRELDNPQKANPLSGDIRRFAFSPDSKWLIVNYDYGQDELRKLDDSQKAYLLSGDVEYVTFSSNSEWLAVKYYYGSIEFREVAKTPGEAYPLSGDAYGFTFSPDGAWLTINYNNSKTPLELRKLNDFQNVYPIQSSLSRVIFSPDSKWLIVSSYPSSELRELAYPEKAYQLSGNTDFYDEAPVTFSSDNKWLVINYLLARGELRDLSRSDGTVYTLTGDINSAILSPNSEWLVLDYQDAPSEVRALSKPNEIAYTLSGDVLNVAFNPDNQWVVVSYSNALSEVREIAKPESAITLTGDVYDLPSGEFSGVTFSQDSNWLLAKYDGIPSQLWSIGSESRFFTNLGLGIKDDSQVNSLIFTDLSRSFDATNQRLLLVYSDGRSYLLDLPWIQAMGGRDDLPREELVKLACDGPLKLGIVTSEDLKPFLGEEESKVCK